MLPKERMLSIIQDELRTMSDYLVGLDAQASVFAKNLEDPTEFASELMKVRKKFGELSTSFLDEHLPE